MEKEKPSFFVFMIFYKRNFGFWVATAPQTPLVRGTCIYFVLTCTSGLMIEKNMAYNLGCCCFIIIKSVDF